MWEYMVNRKKNEKSVCSEWRTERQTVYPKIRVLYLHDPPHIPYCRRQQGLRLFIFIGNLKLQWYYTHKGLIILSRCGRDKHYNICTAEIHRKLICCNCHVYDTSVCVCLTVTDCLFGWLLGCLFACIAIYVICIVPHNLLRLSW